MTSRASPNPVMGSQQRRKTMTRSGQAFAEIVAKAKARAGPEEDEDSSPMASGEHAKTASIGLRICVKSKT